MAFIRKRLTKPKRYGRPEHYQVLESYRENGKVKQRVICNLGACATVEKALKEAEEKLAHAKGFLEFLRNQPPTPRRLSRGWYKRKWGEELKKEHIASQEHEIQMIEKRIKLLCSVKNVVT